MQRAQRHDPQPTLPGGPVGREAAAAFAVVVARGALAGHRTRVRVRLAVLAADRGVPPRRVDIGGRLIYR